MGNVRMRKLTNKDNMDTVDSPNAYYPVADVAQLAEPSLRKREVMGSTPIVSSMNKHCHGDWWVELRIYRCLLNGKLLKLQDLPLTCPECNRQISAEPDYNASIVTEIVTTIHASNGEFELERKAVTEVGTNRPSAPPAPPPK